MNTIKQDLDALYNCAISSIIKETANTHVYNDMVFLSNDEFNEHEHTITKITSSYQRLQDHLDK